jgi:hypothetical protein
MKALYKQSVFCCACYHTFKRNYYAAASAAAEGFRSDKARGTRSTTTYVTAQTVVCLRLLQFNGLFHLSFD